MLLIELFAEREVSLSEGEAPYICPSNTLRTSTITSCLYVVRFLICNSFVIHFAKVVIFPQTRPFLPLIVVNRKHTDLIIIYTSGNTQGQGFAVGADSPRWEIDNHKTSALPYYIYGWTDVLTAVNRANVNVSLGRHLWHDSILKSFPHL